MTHNPFVDHEASLRLASDSIGNVLSVRGSAAKVRIPVPPSRHRSTVGSFLVIGSDRHRPVGMITEIEAERAHDGGMTIGHALAQVELIGQMIRNDEGVDRFHRGVALYPTIGEPAMLVTDEMLRVIYGSSDARTIDIGHLHHDASVAARIDVDNLVSKHFAILGSTGVGKSSGVAVILREIIEARPDLRIFMLDGHNEYRTCFGDRANVVNPRNLKLPFWMFNFDELVDVIYAGHPGVEEELDILAELIPIAKSSYFQYKSASRSLLKRADSKRPVCGLDTPMPYMIQDLLSLVDERMGKLENRSSRMHYHRLATRIEGIRNDPRYGFMFDNANVGGDTMAALLTHLFRLEPDGKPITIMQLAGLPPEVVDAVVCVLCRLAFDFGVWSDGQIPLLFICEEAHRYASADHSIGFAPTRRALARIAKEGRKYGVYLGLVTQRPAELDPTIISQCSTMFAMRMTNDRDQALLRSAVTDAAANLLGFVPSLGTREVVGFGEGVPLPARLTFKTLPSELLPRSEVIGDQAGDCEDETSADFVQSVVDRWRGASLTAYSRQDDAAADEPLGPLSEDLGAIRTGDRIEQARRQLLRR